MPTLNLSSTENKYISTTCLGDVSLEAQKDISTLQSFRMKPKNKVEI